jgi:hypothetical protein
LANQSAGWRYAIEVVLKREQKIYRFARGMREKLFAGAPGTAHVIVTL